MRVVINAHGNIVEDKDELKTINDTPKRLLFIEMSRYTYNHRRINTRGAELKFNSELFFNDIVYHYSDGTKVGI
ncbi:MAG TPA: hypothetical protein VIK72_19485 [Clostridiaceae bacterium]